MVRLNGIVCMAFVAGLSGIASMASAQSSTAVSGRAFLNVNLGAQPNRRTISASQVFTLYGETARIDASQRIANGPLFEVGGGYRLRPAFGVGAAFSLFGSSGTAAMVASIPNPFFFDRSANVSVGATALERREHAVHLRALWTRPVSRRIDVTLSGGPSIIRVSQQIASGTVATGTQTLTASSTEENGTAFGLNAGFDSAYMFSPRLGAGFFIQYSGGSVDLPSANGVKAGGLQTGLGLRARF